MCNGRYPGAIWDPITDRDKAPNRIERMIVHTAWVDARDIYGPRRGQGGTYAHFYNPDDGKLRQHQEVTRMARASLDANGRTVDVEHQDPRRDAPLTAAQIDADARLFAHLVLEHGMPNRIATPNDTRGLAWHRLGVDGNFGAYNPKDRKTWCRKQTGEKWTTVYGKTCPTNPRIDQIDDIWELAQKYIQAASAPAPSIPSTLLEELSNMVIYKFFQLPDGKGEAVANLLFRNWARLPNPSIKDQFAEQLRRAKIPWEWHSDANGSRVVETTEVFGPEVPWS